MTEIKNSSSKHLLIQFKGRLKGFWISIVINRAQMTETYPV